MASYDMDERLWRNDYEKLKAYGRIDSNMTLGQYIDCKKGRLEETYAKIYSEVPSAEHRASQRSDGAAATSSTTSANLAQAAAARQAKPPSLPYRPSVPNVSSKPSAPKMGHPEQARQAGPSSLPYRPNPPSVPSEPSAPETPKTENPPVTYGPPEIEPPIPGIPEAEILASRYWGKLISDTGISPRLNSCVVGICDIASAVSSARPPAVPLEKAAVYLMPEAFATILTLFGIEEPEFGPPQLVQQFGPSFFDNMFAHYYVAFNVPIVWATRPDSDKPNNLPLIKRASVKTWLRNYIRAQPDEFYTRLNEILDEVPELQHPMEDKPFLYKKIPRGCFPAHCDKAASTAIVQAFAQFTAASSKLIANAVPLQTAESARQDYLNVVAQARAQKEYFLNINGGWTKDEYGNDKYVESCIF